MLKKPWIRTGILISNHYKEKLHKKYLIQKRFLINEVLHDIFKRNRNTIKKTLMDTKLITSTIISSRAKMT